MKKITLFTVVITTMLALVACSAPATPTLSPATVNTAVPTKPAALPAVTPTTVPASSVIQVDAATGSTNIDPVILKTSIAPMATGTLSANESAGLILMREEEKLAHDVYIYLFQKWGLNVFQNIANSEQTHTDSVKTLLDRYGLSDPAAGMAAGKFTNTTLQELYDKLVAQGSKSVADALKVGAAVEEIDILDLQKEAGLTLRADILLVYQNLETGSRNHLRSFTQTLKTQTGEVYQPQYLTAEAYKAIVNSTIETGSGKGSGSGKP